MSTFRQSIVAAVLRRYPFYSGAGSLANSRLVAALAGRSNERAWCPTTGGDVLAHLNDFVGRAAFYCGDLDPKVSWVCKQLVDSGDTVCDIGANIGIVTLLLARLAGKKGNVFAFEPNPTSFDSLNLAIERNQLSNVIALPFALGSTSEERTLMIPPDNCGAASLKHAMNPAAGKTTPVSVRTLDDIVAEREISSIQFMKIDVEGFESEVLNGASRVLESIRPNAILFEMNEPSTRPLIEHPVFETLARFEYSFLCAPKHLWKVRPQVVDPRRAVQLPGHDVIAIPTGDSFARAAQKLRVKF